MPVKQLTMTLNASIARAENAFGERVSELSRSMITRALRRATNALSGRQGSDGTSGGS